MNHHEKLRLREREAPPTDAALIDVLGNSFAAYETFQEALPGLQIEQVWQWYTPHKAWFARGQYVWTTPRGTRKEKTLYWLHVYDGYFSVAVWFKEKNRIEIQKANVSESTKALINDTGTMGKVPTFPVVFDITGKEYLTDVYILLKCKQMLER